MANRKSNVVSIGLRAKTARAVAVVLTGPSDLPVALKRTEIALADPAVPATAQPYHEVMELPWDKAKLAVRKTNAKVEAIATRALGQLVQELQAQGLAVSRVGIVGAGDRDLERIGSTHIRAHAAEGVLFRHVLELAAAANGLKSRSFDDRTLDDVTTKELKRSQARVRNHLAEMGRAVGSPWRADEKAAAAAAWLALAARGRE